MRLLFITNVFPNPVTPTKGVFNLHLAGALAGSNRVRVVCPVAWTDEWAGRRRGTRMAADRIRSVAGMQVFHPRYYFTPKMLRGQYGGFMWHSLRPLIRRQLAEFCPDAVLGYWAHPDGEVAVRAARLANVPSLVMVGGSDVLLLTRLGSRRRRILDVLRAADLVVAVSHDLKTRLIEFGIDPAKVHVVQRGVDTAAFNPGNKHEARRRLGISSDQPVLVWVGRMVPVKALDVLLEACGRLKRQGHGVRLFLVGDGPERDKLKAQSEQQGLSESIQFVGSVHHAQLPDWYRCADLVVLPSRSEGVPNVLRESLACRTPFVASGVGGIPEIAVEGASWLVPPDDASALAEGIEQALASVTADAPWPASATMNSWEQSADAISRLVTNLNSSRRAALATLAI